MKELFNVNDLSPSLQLLVREELERMETKKFADPLAPMTYREAATAYGYTYQTIRHHVCRGLIETVNVYGRRMITGRAMVAFIRGLNHTGRPKLSETAPLELV